MVTILVFHPALRLFLCVSNYSGLVPFFFPGIDLENIVYYKDDTHYFVMTAKKKSLLEKGVIKEARTARLVYWNWTRPSEDGSVTHQVSSVDLQDHSDADQLLAPPNVDYKALHLYARDAAHFSTGGKLPDLQFAQNHAGQPDVAMFDFTCMYRAENASLIRERRGRRLLMALVGDCLVEVEGSFISFSPNPPLMTFYLIEISVILDQSESSASVFRSLSGLWGRGLLGAF